METTELERTKNYRRSRRNSVLRKAQGDELPQKNKVVIENGEVKMQLFTDTVDLEEARALLHEVVRLEYSLP